MNEFRGIDLDRVLTGIREAVIDDLIKDLQMLKQQIKIIDMTEFAEVLKKKGKN